MSSDPQTFESPASDYDAELARALPLFYRLSDETIGEINALMKRLHIRFAEAAVRSGAVTREELEQARHWISRKALLQNRGLVADGSQRLEEKRELVLWARDQLVPSAQLSFVHQPDHPRSEKIRSLRTALLLRCKGRRGAKMIALLSPCGREGRSQLAAELAVSFAQLGRRTLLVDADLRKPDQHLLFGADNLTGLAQALMHGGALHLHGVQDLPQMAVMTSGEATSNPLELLSGRQFERLMNRWRRHFEFVIFDTPPTTRFSDGLAVAATAGHVLLLGRAPTTRFDDLNEICRNLSSTRSQILGAVINAF